MSRRLARRNFAEPRRLPHLARQQLPRRASTPAALSPSATSLSDLCSPVAPAARALAPPRLAFPEPRRPHEPRGHRPFALPGLPSTCGRRAPRHRRPRLQPSSASVVDSLLSASSATCDLARRSFAAGRRAAALAGFGGLAVFAGLFVEFAALSVAGRSALGGIGCVLRLRLIEGPGKLRIPAVHRRLSLPDGWRRSRGGGSDGRDREGSLA